MAYCIEEFNSEFNGMEIVWTDNVQYDFPVMTCNNSAGISTNDRWINALQQPTADQLKIFKTKSDHVCTSFFNTIWIISLRTMTGEWPYKCNRMQDTQG